MDNSRSIWVKSLLACFIAVVLYASPALAKKTIYIVNNLDQALNFKEVKNKVAIQFKEKPPDSVAAGATGSFIFDKNRSVGEGPPFHLNIKYTVGDTTDDVGIVYRAPDDQTDHCPKEHPDWIKETVKHCSGKNGDWKYIFDKK